MPEKDHTTVPIAAEFDRGWRKDTEWALRRCLFNQTSSFWFHPSIYASSNLSPSSRIFESGWKGDGRDHQNIVRKVPTADMSTADMSQVEE